LVFYSFQIEKNQDNDLGLLISKAGSENCIPTGIGVTKLREAPDVIVPLTYLPPDRIDKLSKKIRKRKRLGFTSFQVNEFLFTYTGAHYRKVCILLWLQ